MKSTIFVTGTLTLGGVIVVSALVHTSHVMEQEEKSLRSSSAVSTTMRKWINPGKDSCKNDNSSVAFVHTQKGSPLPERQPATSTEELSLPTSEKVKRVTPSSTTSDTSTTNSVGDSNAHDDYTTLSSTSPRSLSMNSASMTALQPALGLQIPLVFTDASTLGALTPAQQEAVGRIAADFNQAVTTAGPPSSPGYYRAWMSAQAAADDAFKGEFGWEAYNFMLQNRGRNIH